MPEPRRGPAAGTLSAVLGPPACATRSCPVKPGAQAQWVGKGTTASGKPTGAPRATAPDEARPTARCQVARQRITPPATTKAHGNLPSNNGRQVPQTPRARTTSNQPRHDSRCGTTPAAVPMNMCAPGSDPRPCQLQNSHPPNGRLRARRVPSPCRVRTAAVQMDEWVPGGYPAHAGYEQSPSGWTSARPAATPRTRNSAQATHSTTH